MRAPPPRRRASSLLRTAAFAFLLTTVIAAFSGCATNKIDWSQRVGTYTRDDAIRELGPPDKSATLSDGSVVADWVTNRGNRTATAFGAGWHPWGPYGWGAPGMVVVDSPSPNRVLRLTFDPQSKLASWLRIIQ